MRTIVLEFHLIDPSVLDDLLRELNLDDEVDARAVVTPDSARTTIEVTLPDVATALWTVRSTVSLFDPDAVEATAGQAG